VGWPTTIAGLESLQRELAARRAPEWSVPDRPLVAGVFVCFARDRGDEGWAGAAVVRGESLVEVCVAAGRARAAYAAGLLALREGPLLEAAVRSLAARPDVLIVNATGRDHPRRAGLALHLGAVLGLPTVGVTHRPLMASGPWPGEERGASRDVELDGEAVGAWLRTRSGARPLEVHPAWGTDVRTAIEVVLGAGARVRTPLPLREARQVARVARSAAQGLTQR
jgi:deoxyribonuclease V